MKLALFFIALTYSLSSIAQPKIKLSWENKHPAKVAWTKITVDEVTKRFDKLDKASDISLFCPPYEMLDQNHKVWVWSELISAIAFHESTWKPTARLSEPSLGNDVVTNKTTVSEGLMQLSYGDTKWAKWCQFDWSRDSHKDPLDPSKTIFQPKNNLECAIGILANQVNREGRIILAVSAYWAVLKTTSKYNKIPQIQRMVQELPFCGLVDDKHKEALDCSRNPENTPENFNCHIKNRKTGVSI